MRITMNTRTRNLIPAICLVASARTGESLTGSSSALIAAADGGSIETETHSIEIPASSLTSDTQVTHR